MSIGIRDFKENWVCYQEGGYYSRPIYRILNDRAYYHAFEIKDGSYIGSHSCTLKKLAAWADSEVGPAIHPQLDLEAAEKSLQKHRDDIHQMLSPFTDNDLLEDLRMRGIQLEFTE